MSLPHLGARLVDLEDAQVPDEVEASQREGIESGPEDHILVVPAVDLLGHNVLDEARPGDDAGAEATEPLTHIRMGQPRVRPRDGLGSQIGGEDVGVANEPQADLVL